VGPFLLSRLFFPRPVSSLSLTTPPGHSLCRQQPRDFAILKGFCPPLGFLFSHAPRGPSSYLLPDGKLSFPFHKGRNSIV